MIDYNDPYIVAQQNLISKLRAEKAELEKKITIIESICLFTDKFFDVVGQMATDEDTKQSWEELTLFVKLNTDKDIKLPTENEIRNYRRFRSEFRNRYK